MSSGLNAEGSSKAASALAETRRADRVARRCALPSSADRRLQREPGRELHYIEHYHRERNHQGIENTLIEGGPVISIVGRIRRRTRLGGLLNYYERAA